MSDYKQPEKQRDEGKKQFYSVNLTPERVFMIFVAFVILIAIVIIIFAFSFSSKSVTDKSVSDKSGETIEDITEADFNYHDVLFDDEVADETEDLVEATTDDIKKPEIVQEKPAIVEKEKGLKVDENKVVYSSKYNADEVVEKTPIKPVPQKKVQPVAVQKKVESKPVVKQKPVEKVEKKPAAAVVKGKKYIIQIASYSTKNAANTVETFYKNAGYPCYVKEFTKDGKVFYRLRLGPYDSKSKAEEYLVNVRKSKYGKDSFISEGYF